jgi:hypothetical protein
MTAVYLVVAFPVGHRYNNGRRGWIVRCCGSNKGKDEGTNRYREVMTSGKMYVESNGRPIARAKTNEKEESVKDREPRLRSDELEGTEVNIRK